MKFELPDGQTLTLPSLSDADYDLVHRQRNLDVCPTCGGKDKSIEGSGGMKQWHSEGYWYQRQRHRCHCQTQIALCSRYLLANIGDQYMRLDWGDFQGSSDADKWVKDYVATWRSYLQHGFGLTFASPTQGVGKTWAATHIGKELIKARQKVYFLDFVQMVDAFCSTEKRSIEDRMRDNTFLILDDVVKGISERQTDLYALKFEVVIRHRTNYNLPTIFTTNLTEEQFEQEFPRIYSLIAPKQLWVTMNGTDFRKTSSMAEATMAMIALGEVQPIT